MVMKKASENQLRFDKRQRKKEEVDRDFVRPQTISCKEVPARAQY